MLKVQPEAPHVPWRGAWSLQPFVNVRGSHLRAVTRGSPPSAVRRVCLGVVWQEVL